ncbi:PREDICTED: microprocessor complex subunit DGCR8-like isoform X1 [Amphimedon queenslandica]|uniref:WW domain-containing protein n=1 Tax=Amphimedon queenslandica TaxID=400682 RepID=A0AAN0JCK2_AMPQE|nr:PREDICTED: microprocessor complex subunit DGCR8-like isoform X1 [Amphimedon queenslandica]|eukprot:XP_019854471.1 PREDICTED: microprocessor complex subunit DGCR8-like isoform X1 [Amphimedon queenslandica]
MATDELGDDPMLSNYSSILPDGWVPIQHESGGQVYFHKPTRVCTWSKPYIVSTSKTIKKHKVPATAIPCIDKWLSGFETSLQLHKIESNKLQEYLMIRWPSGYPIESVSTNTGEKKEARQKRKRKLPAEDQGIVVPELISKVVTVTIPKKYIKPDHQGKTNSATWTVNLSHKPPVSILLEFCQNYLRSEIDYATTETGSGQTPYHCTAVIGGVHYGSGSGSSKRSAKQCAAQTTLELFLPGSFRSNSSAEIDCNKEFEYLSSISIEDIQSPILLNQVGLPSPWSILQKCCQRLKGSGVDEPDFKIELTLPEQETSQNDSANTSSSQDASIQSYYKLSCGPNFQVTGTCRGRKDGQQIAAQKMLKLLHPDLDTWDSLLKIYTGMQSKLPKTTMDHLPPEISNKTENEDLLKQLRAEMRKLTGVKTCNKEI